MKKKNVLFGALACACVFSASVVNADTSNVSMSSVGSVESSFISPGDVLVAGVTAVQEVLAGQDDVIYLNQVLTVGGRC